MSLEFPGEKPADRARTAKGRPARGIHSEAPGTGSGAEPGHRDEGVAGRPLRILIADDHPIVREGLKRVLYCESDMRVEGEAADSEATLELARSEEWDVVVLDLAMPGRGGLEVLNLIRREKPTLPVLVLSVHPEDQLALQVLKAGASGYLNKEAASEELIGAIRRVVGGGKYISPSLAEGVVFGLASETAGDLREILSDREHQVMNLLVAGKTVTEIAGMLSVSVKTISTLRHRLLAKLKLRNNAELIRFSFERRIATN
jgi:two-component system, NarL family, invasion response regulator UvrY